MSGGSDDEKAKAHLLQKIAHFALHFRSAIQRPVAGQKRGAYCTQGHFLARIRPAHARASKERLGTHPHSQREQPASFELFVGD